MSALEELALAVWDEAVSWPMAPEVNVPLLRKSVEWVEEQATVKLVDRVWNQDTYWSNAQDIDRLCGTCYCVAGKIVTDAGGVLVGTMMVSLDGRVGFIDAAAAALLGIDSSESAEDLFAADNTAAEVRRIAERIAGERL